MIPLAPPLRLASADDAPVLARLLDHAGEGLLLYLMDGQLAEPGDGPLGRTGRGCRPRRWPRARSIVVDEGNGPVAGLTGYAIGAEPEPLDGLPAVFVPLQEL